jgi:hypothetical protein
LLVIITQIISVNLTFFIFYRNIRACLVCEFVIHIKT